MSALPPIEEEFIAAGQAMLEVRPIAMLGDRSELAAAAAECANEQGRFWEFHDTLFLNQGGEGGGAFSRDNLKRMAAALALETAAFDLCLDSNRYASKVMADTEAARQEGVSATPTIFVNGRQVGHSEEALRAAIQEELASGS